MPSIQSSGTLKTKHPCFNFKGRVLYFKYREHYPAYASYFTAIHSISTIAFLGKAFTATAERAGNAPSK